MFRSPPHHDYVDILELEVPITTSEFSSTIRSHAVVQHAIYTNGLNNRAVNRLPSEVLHQIFEYYFDLSPVVYTEGVLRPGIYNNMSQQLNPFHLSHVCAYWRAILSSSPEFWSSICIIGPFYKQGYAIETWLSRARPLLTDILFIQLDRRLPSDQLEEATDQTLDAIIRHSPYWLRLRLEFRCCEYQGALSKIDPRKLQRLEGIHLEFPPWALPRPEISRLWSTIFQAPCLFRVSWEAANVLPPIHLARWEHLTWINCGVSITQANLWSIMKVATRLVRLRVRGIFIIEIPIQPPPLDPINHKYLQIMDLEFKSSPIQFYSNLHVPNLTSFRVAQNSKAYDPIDDIAVIGALSRFLRTSCGPSNLKFESLAILDPTVSEGLLLSLLHMEELGHLKYLSLDYATEHIIFHLMLSPQSHGPLLPNLQKLEISSSYLDSLRMTDTVPARVIHQAVKKLIDMRPRGFSVSLNPCGLVLTADTII